MQHVESALGRPGSWSRIVSSIAIGVVASVRGGAVELSPAPVPGLPADPVLAMLIEQSLDARPELAEARDLALADRERVPRLGTFPDPVLQLGVQNDGFSSWEVGRAETSFYLVMASQTFPWPGKLRLRSQVAELGAERAEQGVARLLLSTEADTRRAYLDLVLARERLALIDRLETLWQNSAGIAQTRYEAGQGPQSDVLRARLEFNRIRQRRWLLQVDEITALQTINRLRAHPLDEPVASPVRLAEQSLPELRSDDAAIEDALARSPELAGARLALAQAGKTVDLALKSYRPDITVGAGIMPRGGDLPPMWLLSVSGTLPVFVGSKQGRTVAETRLRERAGRSALDGVDQVLRLRVRQRQTALAAVLETIELYRGGLLVESVATAESTLAQYQVGQVTFASVLEANSAFIADEDGYLQFLAQAQRMGIDALEVSLQPPVVVTGSTGMGSP